MGNVGDKFFSEDKSKAPAKPIFIPDDMANEYGIGISFSTYGKTFLYVGKLAGSAQSVLCISDWSKKSYEEGSLFLSQIEAQGIDVSCFIVVSDKHLHSSNDFGLLTGYVISDLSQMLAMLELIQNAGVDKKPLKELGSYARSLLEERCSLKK